MKNILLIGIGGTGSEAVDVLFKKIHELGQQNDNIINAIVLDTDAGDLDQIKEASVISMADNASVGTIVDSIGKEGLEDWFPVDVPAIRTQEMIKGASQWRKKSFLAFLNAMNKPKSKNQFETALERMTIDPNASCEVYIIASIAGGTGSGSFIPIALYVRQYLRKHLGKNPMIYAMIALPDIFAKKQTKDNLIKVYANAYAILRELNAINLVARDYNKGRSERKQTPIKFKIGDERERNIGLLFDASDPKYWTPEAAPFNQIFLLDKLPLVNSIKAHNIVLANSLYTLLCTDIGNKFDSEVSNHELLRSQNNGSNAIYAGISTSQINFPIESILDYLAHEKTVSACEEELLVIHKQTEERIKECEENEKDSGRRYVMKDGEYADLFTKSFKKLDENEVPLMIIQIIKNDIVKYDEDGKTPIDLVEKYLENLETEINKKISHAPIAELESKFNIKDFKKTEFKKIQNIAASCYGEIKKYYADCIDQIRKSSRNLGESIFSYNPESFKLSNKNIALVENLLMRDGKYIHPVSAVIQLSNLKLQVNEITSRSKNKELWPEVKRGDVKKVYEKLLILSEESGIKNCEKSYYFQLKDKRFMNLVNDSRAIKGKIKTKIEIDNNVLKEDVMSIAKRIKDEAVEQVKKIVFERLSADISLLLDKYRVFFNRFEKEKIDLIEETKTAKKMNSVTADSIINVYSSEKEKEEILDSIFKANGPLTEEEIQEANNIMGEGIFKAVYDSASAFKNAKDWNDKDSSSYKSLFSKMIEAYKNSIRKSEAFEELAASSVVEAIVRSAGPNATFNQLESKFRQYFSAAQDSATPSIQLKNDVNDDLVETSEIVVFMMSYDTAKYIKQNAELLKLTVPADQSSEEAIVYSCAEQFISNYANNDNVRVTIVKNMPSKVLYCTGEIMDITPLRIAKFDELSSDKTYYKHYVDALKRFKAYNTEMWNPHLGDNLHKRGFLPYMNPEFEKECDRKMIKALLHALGSDKITFDSGFQTSKHKSFRYTKDGRKEQIKSPEGQIVQEFNIAKLIAWIRNEEELIERWSEDFDNDIKNQLADLPILNGDNEIGELETKISQSIFIKQLTGLSATSNKENVGLFALHDSNKRLTIFDFAYMIKNNEESDLDCDDAERILEVAYETFMKFVNHRTPKNVSAERFIQVYKQQIKKVYRSILKTAASTIPSRDLNNVKKAHNSIKNLFNAIMFWVNSIGTFKGIGDDKEAINSKGEVLINKDVSTKTNDLCTHYLGEGGRIVETIKELKSYYNKVEKENKVVVNEDGEEVEEQFDVSE